MTHFYTKISVKVWDIILILFTITMLAAIVMSIFRGDFSGDKNIFALFLGLLGVASTIGFLSLGISAFDILPLLSRRGIPITGRTGKLCRLVELKELEFKEKRQEQVYQSLEEERV